MLLLPLAPKRIIFLITSLYNKIIIVNRSKKADIIISIVSSKIIPSICCHSYAK